MAVDDTYTKSLLHFDGANNGTTFTDESGKTWTPSGNAKTSTTQYEFGTASGLFDGTGDYISTPDSADFALGSGDGTVDFWVRFAAFPAIGVSEVLFGQSVNAANWIYAFLYNATGTYIIGVSWGDGGVTRENQYVTWTGVAINTWYHVAFVKVGSVYKIYINGTQMGAALTFTHDWPDMAAAFNVGADIFDTNQGMNGYIDEFRFTKGLARWTANFTPPTGPYGPQSGVPVASAPFFMI